MAALNKVNPQPRANRASEAFQRSRSDSSDGPKKINDYFEEPDYGVGVAYDPNFQGPVKNRKCTDILCLALFIVFLCGWGVVAYFAIQKGDIDRVSTINQCFQDLKHLIFLLYLTNRCKFSVWPQAKAFLQTDN